VASFMTIHIMLYLLKDGKYPAISLVFPCLLLMLISLFIRGITGSDVGWVLTGISTVVNTVFWFLSFHWKNKQA
jgi:hypothetical protein